MRSLQIPSLLAALALAIANMAPAVAAPPSQQGAIPFTPHFSDSQRADLRRASIYLNSIKNVQGRFVQVANDGKSVQGNFYLKKPGRVRFEYQKPNPNLIVADGTSVAVQNMALHTTDRYPLLNSPLRILLGDNDLVNDTRIVAVKQEPGALSITAREVSGPAAGSITMLFADSGGNLELRQWDVVDPQGAHTTIVLNEMRQVADIPAQLFVIEDLSPFKKNGR